jgi:Zn-dependent protease with chaperone function
VTRGKLGRLTTASCWVLLPLAVLAHLTLAVLAVAEFATLGWPLPTWFDTGAVTLVLATAVAGLAASAVVALRAAAGSRALRALIHTGRRPVPPSIQNEAAALGCAARLDAVAGEEAFAVTYGLIRPRILVSTGLAAALTPAEVRAVLAHEREHLRHRDPLRLLAARLVAAWGCYLPAAGWLAGRAALRRELAADRAATGRAGRGVLAGALLKLAAMPACPAVAAASPAGDGRRSLEARVIQLEAGRPPQQRPAVSRLLASGGALALLAPASLCCAAMSQFLPGGLL